MARNRMEQMQTAETNESSQNLVNTSQPAATSSSASAAPSLDQKLKSDLSHAQTLLILISNQLALMRRRFQDKDAKSQNQQEWYLIALTLDRFCLLVYTVITALGLVSIFLWYLDTTQRSKTECFSVSKAWRKSIKVFFWAFLLHFSSTTIKLSKSSTEQNDQFVQRNSHSHVNLN